MKKLLRGIRRALDRRLGSGVDKLYWRFRHLFGMRRWAESYISAESLSHPQRKFLLDTISRYAPFESALEIGCASGPNLYLLAKRFPYAKLQGIDISPRAVAVGRSWLLREGEVKTVSLAIGQAEHLPTILSKSFAVVFSDATLIYLGPDKIEAALREMIRIAEKAVVLLEWHTDSKESVYHDHWAHNYRALLLRIAPGIAVSATKLPADVFTGEWARYGYCIEARLGRG